MEIKEVVRELMNKGVLEQQIVKIEPLSGGTMSKLFLLYGDDDSKVVVKFNEPQVVQAEAYFLHFYRENPLFPRLLYVEESFKFIVYSFVSGSTNYVKGNKAEILNSVVQSMIIYYQPVFDAEGWGWVDEPSKTWVEFLFKRVQEVSEIVYPSLNQEDINLVSELVKRSIASEGKPFLLHGDCGVHNFIFEEGRLSGVIDPTPVLGTPLYDLIYAFCSTSEDLTIETLYPAASQLKMGHMSNQQLNEEVLIGLFLRIASCIKHHPNDLPEYLKAWEYWKDRVMQVSKH